MTYEELLTAEILALRKWIGTIQALVDKQAKDEALWAIPMIGEKQSIVEAYLHSRT